ncbi:MAG: hypothetical protein ACI9FJ_001915 [Alteromonadaceae bacterium]|jgi:hypothetical protein
MRSLSGLLRLIIGCLLGLVLALGIMMPEVMAAQRPNLLIMGEDADQDSIPSDSRVFKRVLNALANQLHDSGYDVFDETAITQAIQPLGQRRRSDADIIDIARMIQHPPIDVVVLFSIYGNAQPQGSISQVRMRIEGRLLNAQTGQRLGNFEVKTPDRYNRLPHCERECLLETIGDHSSTLAYHLGEVLGKKLDWLINDSGGKLPAAFTLVFDNFSPDDVMAIEAFLVVFSGYQNHRPIFNSMTRAEVWYQTTISPAKLSRNLHKMLNHLELSGVVQFWGNTYTLQKITLLNKG